MTKAKHISIASHNNPPSAPEAEPGPIVFSDGLPPERGDEDSKEKDIG